MEKLCSLKSFRVFLFVVFALISLFMLYLLIDTHKFLLNNRNEHSSHFIYIVTAVSLFLAIHFFFAIKEKEMLYTRPMFYFILLSIFVVVISILVSLNWAKVVLGMSLILEIIIYSIGDIELTNKKIDKEMGKWDFTPIA